MPRFTPVDPAEAQGKARTLLDAVKAKMGLVPNLTKVLAIAPAALDGYLAFSTALAGGVLSPKVREQLALTIAETNLCGYCLSAHSVIGAKLGLAASDITAARRATATDPKTAAILKLARALVLQRGEVSDQAIAEAREGSVTDPEIVEIVAHVALNIYTNYINHVAQTVVDFPVVQPGV